MEEATSMNIWEGGLPTSFLCYTFYILMKIIKMIIMSSILRYKDTLPPLGLDAAHSMDVSVLIPSCPQTLIPVWIILLPVVCYFPTCQREPGNSASVKGRQKTHTQYSSSETTHTTVPLHCVGSRLGYHSWRWSILYIYITYCKQS